MYASGPEHHNWTGNRNYDRQHFKKKFFGKGPGGSWPLSAHQHVGNDARSTSSDNSNCRFKPKGKDWSANSHEASSNGIAEVTESSVGSPSSSRDSTSVQQQESAGPTHQTYSAHSAYCQPASLSSASHSMTANFTATQQQVPMPLFPLPPQRTETTVSASSQYGACQSRHSSPQLAASACTQRHTNTNAPSVHGPPQEVQTRYERPAYQNQQFPNPQGPHPLQRPMMQSTMARTMPLSHPPSGRGQNHMAYTPLNLGMSYQAPQLHSRIASPGGMPGEPQRLGLFGGLMSAPRPPVLDGGPLMRPYMISSYPPVPRSRR